MHLLSLLHQEVLRHQCQKSWFRFSRRKMLRGEKHWPGRRSDRVAEQNQSSSTWHPHTWASPSPCPGGGPEVLKIVHKELSAVPWWGTPPWLDTCLQRMWKPIPAPLAYATRGRGRSSTHSSHQNKDKLQLNPGNSAQADKSVQWGSPTSS